MTVGIDCMSFDVPKLYLPIDDLATNRQIEPDKLRLGLGLERMSFPDVHQDAVVFAANALLKLIQKESIAPKDISKIYIGTESSVDGAKPIGTYVTEMIEQVLGKDDLFERCDVIDMTFACIGAVDAMHICADYIRLNPDKKAIVIATDVAKYDLDSTGEYTQGAGAVAMLIKSQPRILSVNSAVGVSTKSVFDFFKPYRLVDKRDITGHDSNKSWYAIYETEIMLHKEQPVFDGQYSNACYVDRVKSAYTHFKAITNRREEVVFEAWNNIIMHLPYCYQGRRMFVDVFAMEKQELLSEQNGKTIREKLKLLAKSDIYKTFVKEKFVPSELLSGKVGNIYTGSIFLGLISALTYNKLNDIDVSGQTLGFIAYGSGSKSKVFEGVVADNWQEMINVNQIMSNIETAKPIDFKTYEALYKKERKQSIIQPKAEFALISIEKEKPMLIGARYYQYFD